MEKMIFTVLAAVFFCFGSCCIAIARVQRRFIRFAFATGFLFLFPTQKALSQGNNYEGPIGVTGIFNGNVTTGCSYDPLTHSAHRAIDDIVVPGSIGKYPLKMTRYYNSRSQYYAQGGPDYNPAIGLGPGWSHEYSWLLWADGHKVVSPHGNVYDDSCGAPVGVSEHWEGNRGETWRLADGGKVHFNGGQVDYIEDPYGLRTTIDYQNGRRWRMTEPGGRCLIFTYNATDTSDGTRLLTTVEAYDYYGGHRIDWVSYSYRQYNPVDPLPQGRQPKMMLRIVTYSDGTSATYDYTYDNVREDPLHGTFKMYPLLQRCDDVRYNGPMRTIWYDYQNGGPHGAIIDEKYPGVGAVSAIQQAPGDQDSFIETRGDGPTRKFTYTHFTHCQGDECGCNDYSNNNPPQQMLDHYTDFQGHTAYLGYDQTTWYITSVRDANDHTTYYTPGNVANSIGEITQIKHPDNTTINYAYYRNGNTYDPHYLVSITNERGNITFLYRDPDTHLITGTQHWDANNYLLAYEEFQYNSFGQLTTHHLPSNALKNGAYEHFQYDDRGLLIKRWNPTNTASYPPPDTEPHTTYDYYTAADGSYIASDGQPVYPWIDRVKKATLPANVIGNAAWDTYEYDKNAQNQARPGRGLVTKITHAETPNNTYQSFGYDAYGNKLWGENELGKRTSYTYDAYNRVLDVKDPIGQTTGHTTSYTYKPTNGNGTSPFLHTTNNSDTVTTPTGIVTTNDYDENFRRISSTVGSSTTRFGYDNVGNPTTVTDPLAHTTTTDYDARNRKWHVWDAQWHRTIFEYDPTSNVISITRPDNRVETKEYDGMNRMIRQTVPKSSTESLTNTFGYWPSGKLFWVQDPKQQGGGPDAATYFEYNESDERIRMWYPGRTQKQEWTYDDAHNLASHTTVGGKTEQFTYDIRNRKDTMTCTSPTQWIEWADYDYDAVGRLTSAKNGTGQWLQNRVSTVIRQYDDAGRLTLDQQNINGLGVASVYHGYDDDGKETHLWVPGGSYDYTFGYDPVYGRFETIKPTGQSVAFQYYYDAASNEIHRDNLLNRVTQIYNRDNLNRIWRLDVKKGALLLGREDYSYDAMNRLVSTTREDNKQDQYGYYWDGELLGVNYGANPTPTPSPPPSPTPPPGGQVAEPTFAPGGGNIYPATSITVTISTATTGASIRYTIDGTNWTTIANNGTVNFAPGSGKTLTAIGFKSGMADSDPHSEEYYYDNGMGPMAPDTFRTVVYYYDGAGNRTSVNDNGIITNYASNPLNEYDTVTGSNISNGSEHEITTYNNVNYTYLTDEHLVSVSSGSNSYSVAYDALGRCVKRTLNSVPAYYIYDGEKPILEYQVNPIQIVARNVYGKGIDEILMRTATGINGGQPLYYQQDHEGSVTHLTNASGTVIEKYRYDVFGNPVTIYSNGTYNNRFKFTGREFNSTFGFYEYRARAYHPILGRFMSEDPKLFDPGDYNLFRYCHNDPMDFTDPMGTVTDTRQEEPWFTHTQQAKAINLSASEAVWQRQMNFSSSFGAISHGMAAYAYQQVMKALGGAVQANFYVREGQLTLVNRSRSEALAVRMESGKGPATNLPEAEALKSQGPLPRGSYRILSRTQNGSQLYKHTGFHGYILAPMDSTPFNDRYDVFRRGSFRMHYGTGVGCLTTCVPGDFARVQSFLERSSTVLQPSVTGWDKEQFYGILNVNTSIHD